MTLPATTLDDLRTDLVAGIGTHNRRRRARRRLAAAVPVAAVAIIAGSIATGRGDPPAYALTQRADGTIRVQVYPSFDEVDALQASLADVGLDATVIHLRSHPSHDGLIEVVSHDNQVSGAFVFDNGEFVIDVPAVTGEIEILIYTAAEEGAAYQMAPSVFAPGQELAGLPCAYPNGALTTAELERHALDVGISDILWVTSEGSGAATTYSDDLDERPEGVVTDAQLWTSTTLRVFATTDPLVVPAADLMMSTGTHFGESPPCTPELAARWS